MFPYEVDGPQKIQERIAEENACEKTSYEMDEISDCVFANFLGVINQFPC